MSASAHRTSAHASSADRKTAANLAMGYLMINLLVWPGAGTLCAKDKKNGWFQVKLSLLGIGLIGVGMATTIATIVWMARTASAPSRPDSIWIVGAWGVNIALCLIGCILILWAWIASIIWGIRHVRTVGRHHQ